jgi:hypothetical protein
MKQIAKALVLENGHFSEMDGHTIDGFVRSLEKEGTKVTIINHAHQNKEQILAELPDTDAIVFASTFLYPDQIKGIGDMLKVYPKEFSVYGYVIAGGSLQSELERIWSVGEMKDLARHRIYEIEGDRIEIELVEIDMNHYVKEWERLEKERVERNAGFPRTGRRVRVLDVKAQGPEFKVLKEGMVLDELDCNSIDPNPSRGIWVMGATEPVKLLNDDRMEEWQYEDLKASTLTREFFSMGRMLDKPDLLEVVEEWMKKSLPSYSDSEVWDWCDNLCKTLNVERRYYRHYFEGRLREYRKKHTYFKE